MSLNTFFNPQSIAVIGASKNSSKVGFTILKNLIDGGYAGKIYPVNPKSSKILGRTVYKKITDIAEHIDTAIIVVPAAIVPQVLKQCGIQGVSNVVIISSGFKEVGKNGAALEREIKEISDKYSMRLLGPNCLGFIDTVHNINASFASSYPKDGNIAFLSQSGAMIVALIDWAQERNLGMSRLVSFGNKADISEVELLEQLESDSRTKVIGLYVEEISNIREFIHVASRVSKKKSIIVLKAGKSTKGKAAVQSHTGSLAASDAVFSAALKQAGIVEVSDVEDLFNVLHMVSRYNIPPKPRVTVVTNAGGPGIIVTDALDHYGIPLQQLSTSVRKKLKEVLPPEAAGNNPVDIIGDADLERFKNVLEIVFNERVSDLVIVLITPQAGTPIEPLAQLIDRMSWQTSVAIAVSFIGGSAVEPGRSILLSRSIPHFNFPIDSIRALTYVACVKEKHTVYPHRKYIPPPVGKPVQMPYRTVHRILKRDKFPLVDSLILTDASEVAKVTGYPVAIKVLSQNIVHKKSEHALKLHIANRDQLRSEILRFEKQFKNKKIDGYLIQPMVETGTEFIMGIKREEGVGASILFGLGGSLTEVLHDVTIKLLPASELDITNMIREIRHDAALKNVDVMFIKRMLKKLAEFANRYPEIQELDFNPVSVYNKGGKILDARIVSIKK